MVGLGLALDQPVRPSKFIGNGTNYANDSRTGADLATLDPDGLERDRPAVATALARAMERYIPPAESLKVNHDSSGRCRLCA
jgi:hypothetical protein